MKSLQSVFPASLLVLCSLLSVSCGGGSKASSVEDGQIFVEAWTQVIRHYVGEPDISKLAQGAISGMEDTLRKKR